MSKEQGSESAASRSQFIKEEEMAKEEEAPKKVSRREFVKGAAAVAGAGALASCAPAATPTTAPEAAPTCPPAAECAPCPVAGVPEKWDYEADVVVVGYGGAGGCAAIEAADSGAKVLLVEKQPEDAHYSNTRMSGGIYHNVDPSVDNEMLKQYLLGMFSAENLPWKLEGEQPHVSEELVENFAEYIVHNVEWMKSLDPDYAPFEFGTGTSFPMFPGAAEIYDNYHTVRSSYPEGETSPDVLAYEQPRMKKQSGEAFMECVSTGVKDRGIDILYSSPAKRLVEKDGEIIGVVAEQGGTEIACKAKKAVILTTGGYEYNVAMRRAFLKGPGVKGWAFYGSPDNTGDGIEMAIRVGAAQAKVHKAASRVITAVPYGRGYEETGLKMGLISPAVAKPNSVVVDNHGKRYWNEFDITNSAAPFRYLFYEEAVRFDMKTMDYPRDPSWLIFDETLRARDTITMFGVSTAGFGFVPWTADNLDAINRGWIFKGDTIAEVAAKIEADPDNRHKMDAATLAETVEGFNSYCAAGEDAEFGREPESMGPIETPPFYALRLYPGGPNTKGGIDADGQRRVLNWEGKPMPRLYTAGEISSAFKHTYQGGGNVTECIVCGRIAGKNAAAETSWE